MKARHLLPRAALAMAMLSQLGAVSATPPRAALHVARVLPAPGSSEVPPSGLVTVIFDRPVVPLARLGSGPPAATISPPVAGQQRWLGTDTWAIIPSKGLAPATTYTLRLNPALRATDGTTLPGPRSWQFTTLRAAVAKVVPADNARYMLPRVPIDVVFNVPVVHASAQSHFSLRLSAGGAPVAGRFTWRDASTMRFIPSAPLPRGSFPRVHVSAGVLAVGGRLPGFKAFSSSFGVAPAFALSSTDPADGSTDANPSLTVQLHFTAPVDPNVAARYLRVEPALSAMHVDAGDQNTVTINGNYRPSTAYRITLRAGLPSLLGDRLPSGRTISFRTAAYQPSLQLFGSLNTYDAYRGVSIYAGLTNVSRVTFNLYRLNETDFLRISSPSFDRSTFAPSGPAMASATRNVQQPLNKAVTIAQHLTVNGQEVPPGYYVVGVDAAGVSAVQYLPLLVTRSSVTFKFGDSQVLVWVNDLRSGAPLGGLPVRIVTDKGAPVLAGRTGADGVYLGTVPRGKHLAYRYLRVIVDRLGDTAAAGGEWTNGINSYDYNLPFDPTLNHVRIYLNTDRPIYRPGQTVYFRGVVRGDDDGRYHLLPAGTSALLVGSDAQGHKIYQRYLPVNGQGIISGQMALPDGASLGGYSLQATISAETTGAYFTVAAYHKPSFQVTVRPDRGEGGQYVQGERIAVTAHADYYFGAPVPQAPVQWTVSSATTQFQPAGYDGYNFVDPELLYQQYTGPSNQQISTFNGHTDTMGGASLTVPADTQGSALPQLVTVEANVTSPTQQQVAQQSSVIVNPAAAYVGLRPQNYLAAPNTPQAVELVTVRPGGSPAPHVAVTLNLQSRSIYSVQVFDPQAGYMWQNRYKDTTIHTFTAVTDGSGHALVRVTLPKEGEYRLAASARDAQGHTARTAAYLYSMVPGGSGYIDWGIANNDRINLVADRRQYSVGQTAHILVPAPFAGMSALVTLERGTFLSRKVLTLRGNGPVLDIQITPDSVPNVYVSVVLFKGSGPGTTALPVWKMGYTTLVVNPQERALTVRVTPSTTRARPGQRLSLAIHTQDAAGHPVAAAVGVSIVDAAILALAGNGNGTLSNAFYAQRPLGITTAASMNLFVDRLDLTQGNGKKGGGAGGGGGPASVRVKFPDTAYWNPNVVTDAQGNATLNLTLPDNLTTWHIAADGSTAVSTLLGSGGSDFVATKPVLIQTALPRFLALRDQSKLGAVISNTTGKDVRVTVQGTAQLGTATQTLAAQPLIVPAHADRAVYWTYSPQTEGLLRVTLRSTASMAELSDALSVSLPVEQNSLISPEAAATAGQSSGTTVNQVVTLPGNVEPGEGDLRVTLEPSLVSGLTAAGAYLNAYTYNGVEQVTSRMGGLLALGSLSPSLKAGFRDTVIAQIARLYTLQGSDGGWGWWPESPSDPYLSAYAYEGLTFAREQGYAIDSAVMNNALNYLQGRVTAPSSDPYAPNDATLAFILYALGRAGHPDGATAATLFERERQLGPGARAVLTLALSGAFGTKDPRVHTLVGELSDAARLTSVDAHWDAGATPDWETMETSVADTAQVLRMLVNLDPHNPLIPRAVRWLMAQRGVGAAGEGPGPDGAWESTQATALALRAVAFYVLNTGGAHPSYRYAIQVNNSTLQQGTVTPATAGQPRQVAIPLDTLRKAGGRAVIRITRQALPGAGSPTAAPMYYTVRLRYYPTPGSVGAVDSGISVSRRYLTRSGRPLPTGAASGAALTVELRLVAPQDLSRVMIQDPLPAGAEAVDGTLLTSSIFAQPGNTPGSPGYSYKPPKPGQPQDLGLYVDHTELLDDRVTLFATSIPAGTYVYRYTIHLTTPGTYHVLPASAAQVYAPEVFGHTALRSFVVG